MTPIQTAVSDHKALVLVGGLGTRLRAVYADGPKAMAPINGRPFLALLLERLARSGFKDVVLCVGYRAEAIQSWFKDGAEFGLRIQYSIEDQLLGTAGAIRLGVDRFAAGQRVLAMNGDTWHALDYHAMLEHHLGERSVCTIALTEVPDAGRYGSVELNSNSRVTGFLEKSAAVHRGWINSGTYLLEHEVIELIPADRVVSLEREVLPRLIQSNVVGFCSNAYFVDIGIPADYQRAQQELERTEAL
jgi:NDP-sugar pyrophosphorylase family protein